MNLLTCDGELGVVPGGINGLEGSVACSGNWDLVDAAEIVYEVSFSPELFSYGFLGVLSVWGIGLGTGLIVGQVRKIK